MCLSVEHIFIKTDEIRWRKDQVEIFERLSHPETLFSYNCQPSDTTLERDEPGNAADVTQSTSTLSSTKERRKGIAKC